MIFTIGSTVQSLDLRWILMPIDPPVGLPRGWRHGEQAWADHHSEKLCLAPRRSGCSGSKSSASPLGLWCFWDVNLVFGMIHQDVSEGLKLETSLDISWILHLIPSTAGTTEDARHGSEGAHRLQRLAVGKPSFRALEIMGSQRRCPWEVSAPVSDESCFSHCLWGTLSIFGFGFG